MSYDIEVYTVTCPEFSGSPFDQVDDPSASETRRISGKDWQVVIHGPDRVEDEDLSDEVSRAVPGLQYLTMIHVEPTSAPKRAYSLASQAARSLARRACGVIVDQQTGTISASSGVKRFAGASRDTDTGTVALGWLFLDVEQFRREGFVQLLDLMEARLPELLPRRYGAYEPPQYQWEEQGRSHFVRFMEESRYDAVWYPHKPAGYVGLGVPFPPGPERRGFRAAYLHAHFSDRVLSQAGWDRQLLRFFLRASSVLRPFYAEIRLGSVLPKSWWWNGIPVVRGLCTLIGPPYVELWPEFAGIAERTPDGLPFVDSFSVDSRTPRDALPGVPQSIAQPPDKTVEIDSTTGEVLSWTWHATATQYPPVWPFDGPTA